VVTGGGFCRFEVGLFVGGRSKDQRGTDDVVGVSTCRFIFFVWDWLHIRTRKKNKEIRKRTKEGEEVSDNQK
jgi:hypothetical protein